ncbi:MAG: low molecular weight protein-tyrosine-phosphatase [Bacteroidia bacterium]|jgi:protein-tyrosine phosphatase
MIGVLFVCLGNICRSPMAEGVFRHLVEERGLAHRFHIDSAGTASYHIGELPDERARQVCLEKGIVLRHKARAIHSQDANEFNYLVVMDHSNKRDLDIFFNKYSKKNILLFGEWFNAPVVIPDPYYGKLEGFYEVYDLVEKQTRELLEYVCYTHAIEQT